MEATSVIHHSEGFRTLLGYQVPELSESTRMQSDFYRHAERDSSAKIRTQLAADFKATNRQYFRAAGVGRR